MGHVSRFTVLVQGTPEMQFQTQVPGTSVNERQEFGNPVSLHGVSNMVPKGVRLCDRGVRCYPTLSSMQDRGLRNPDVQL